MKLAVIRRLLPDWGTTYGPSRAGPYPSVLLLHGSEGGLSGWTHRTAAILASNGFLCYPHSYSKGGNAWNAGHIEDVEISQTAEAMSALRSFEASNGKVALYGVSRGAEHALLLATLMAQNGFQGLPDAVAWGVARLTREATEMSAMPDGRSGIHQDVRGHGMEAMMACSHQLGSRLSAILVHCSCR